MAGVKVFQLAGFAHSIIHSSNKLSQHTNHLTVWKVDLLGSAIFIISHITTPTNRSKSALLVEWLMPNLYLLILQVTLPWHSWVRHNSASPSSLWTTLSLISTQAVKSLFSYISIMWNYRVFSVWQFLFLNSLYSLAGHILTFLSSRLDVLLYLINIHPIFVFLL